MSRISVFGLGYVGVVTAGCLARDGHTVVGVDTNAAKVEAVNAGRSPIMEADTPEIVWEAVRKGTLRATLDADEAVAKTDLSMICVGTPSQLNGDLDLKYVRRVSEQIGRALRDKSEFHVVVCRSTVLPGSMRGIIMPVLEDGSGKRAGTDFGVCNNPEFLREGSAVSDFDHPPKIVIGQIDARSGDTVACLYERLDAPMIRTSVETAEMVKYVDNVWHALKICFANEIGGLCKALGLDSHEVMDIFCRDTKLNLSSCYLQPGFAFGGSCLPKDVRALTYKARTLDVDSPVLGSILASNERQIVQAFRMITRFGHRRIGILGLSFKPGTDDLRESPMVELVERLLGKGYDVLIYDENVRLQDLTGANRDYILNRIPHIAPLLTGDPQRVLEHGQVIVVGKQAPALRAIVEQVKNGQVIVDLARIADRRSDAARYEGIGW
ncbi:MAG: UDP-glucose/GDP-mannose dehydrogenase family protein [Sedimentisphaerales bacterium]|nr:UDP-glucose/GDP-mannose dehydrogenase family protein [Sedimentisphaerales bacterium]